MGGGSQSDGFLNQNLCNEELSSAAKFIVQGKAMT